MLHQKNVALRSACIETLESRRLLSASPVAHVLPALVETHAVKAKASIPAIAGTTYAGTFRALGHTFSITFVFSTESSTGALTATVSSNVSAGLAFSSTGTVKNTRAVALRGKDGTLKLSVAAKLSTTLGKLTGKATVHGKQSVGAAFTATLTPAV